MLSYFASSYCFSVRIRIFGGIWIRILLARIRNPRVAGLRWILVSFEEVQSERMIEIQKSRHNI